MVRRIKYYWIIYYELDKPTNVFVVKDKKVDSKEFAEFIINNAYNNDITLKEVREI